MPPLPFKTPKEQPKKDNKFFVMSTYGELLDLAMHLSRTYDVVFLITDPEYKKIGEGLVNKADNWHDYLGDGWIFVVDGCESAKLQDWLRSQGEWVVGTNVAMAEYENDRQKGQAWFKELGFRQPESQNFTDFDSAKEYVSKSKRKLILKQNGDASKSLNHKAHFEDNADLLYHLEQLEKSWNEAQNGAIDFDLMEVVEGMEVAASAFFNGEDWLRNEDGQVVGFLNWEHKKETDGDLGETTGEMGTLFKGVDEDSELFADILLRDGMADTLAETGYRGVFDVNGCLTSEGYVAFEPTCRFGVPATSYEFMEGLETDTGELLDAMAKGLDTPIEVSREWGVVQVVAAKPYPVESDLSHEATSLGVRLWPLKDGTRTEDFTMEQRKHVHLENFKKKDGAYIVATKSGYLFTVTSIGDSIEEARENALEYTRANIHLDNMKYRQDIGKHVEPHENDYD